MSGVGDRYGGGGTPGKILWGGGRCAAARPCEDRWCQLLLLVSGVWAVRGREGVSSGEWGEVGVRKDRNALP